MKTSVLILIGSLLLLVSCSKNNKAKTISPPKEFSYLIGDWERTNEEDGKETFEHWRAEADKSLRGIGYTLQDGDTIFKENMRIVKIDSTWLLKISGVNESPTSFKIMSRDTNSFIAENPTNEFPSQIRYNYFDDVLTAQISGDAMEVSFIFWRLETD